MPAPTEPPPPLPPSRRRRALRLALRGGLGLLVFVALYFLAVLVLGWIPVNTGTPPPPPATPAEGVEIRVWSNGSHVDFLLPTRDREMDWAAFAPFSKTEAPGPEFSHVLIGWGDRDFYIVTRTAADLSVPVTLKAILLPSRSAVHVSYRTYLPEPGPRCVKLLLNRDQYRNLVRYIRSSFDLDAAGMTQRIDGASYHDRDAFYVGAGSYHLFHTCNNWANGALKSIGVRTAAWSPFEYAIFEHLEGR